MIAGKGDKHILIESCSQLEAGKILEEIHNQLVDNEDYINNNIVLSGDGCDVHLYIFKEANDVPKIQI